MLPIGRRSPDPTYIYKHSCIIAVCPVGLQPPDLFCSFESDILSKCPFHRGLPRSRSLRSFYSFILIPYMIQSFFIPLLHTMFFYKYSFHSRLQSLICHLS